MLLKKKMMKKQTKDFKSVDLKVIQTEDPIAYLIVREDEAVLGFSFEEKRALWLRTQKRTKGSCREQD